MEINRTFKNKKTGEIIKLVETDNPNWKWSCRDEKSMETFVMDLAMNKDVDEELKKNWEEL